MKATARTDAFAIILFIVFLLPTLLFATIVPGLFPLGREAGSVLY
jgi:hypothetical protein